MNHTIYHYQLLHHFPPPKPPGYDPNFAINQPSSTLFQHLQLLRQYEQVARPNLETNQMRRQFPHPQ